MNKARLTIGIGVLAVLSACSEEPVPVSVAEFMDNPRLLESAMVRCAADRAKSRYEAECINARDAVNRIEAAQEKIRREELEKQSERKRKALRRTQEAVAEARRQALEAQRRREEEEYLGLFEPPPENSPVREVEVAQPMPQSSSNAPEVQFDNPAENTAQNGFENTVENTVENPPVTQETTDLDSIREELKRRQVPVQ